MVHKGLRRFVAENDSSGLSPAVVGKLRNILTFLQMMQETQELSDVPSWNVHRLTGGRRGTWSISVTRNWRLTFRVDEAAGEICDLNFEDYH